MIEGEVHHPHRQIGIAYSGSGSLLVVELGVARAFVRRGIVPTRVAGVSSGAITAVAHALDPVQGRGLDVAAQTLGGIRNRTFGLAWWQVALRLTFGPRSSLGDNQPIKTLVLSELARHFGLTDPTLAQIGPPSLRIGAADRLNGQAVWFPPDQPLGDALLASSAIPGLFPWRTLSVNGERRMLVDGGVLQDQPVSELASCGCGTIFSVAVGSLNPKPPTNLVANAVGSFSLAVHQAAQLEEELVRRELAGRARVFHVHPHLNHPVKGFNFTPELVRQVMDRACQMTERWLAEQGF